MARPSVLHVGRAVWSAALLVSLPAHAVMDGVTARETAVVGLTHDGRVACTGTFIEGGAVLTAAHCIRETPRNPALALRWGDALASEASVSAWLVAPTFDPDTLDGDLSLLLLDSPGATPPPEAILAEPPDLAVGTPVRLVGYGPTGAPPAEPQQTTGRARISAVGPEWLELVADPARACFGDSGGPVFVEQGDRRYLVGVISSGMLGCHGTTVATRVAAFAAFVNGAIADARSTDRLAGQSCVFNRNCRGGRCARGGSNAQTAACAAPCAAGCPRGWRCSADTDACLPDLAPGSVGAACGAAADCQELTCHPSGGDSRICTRPCRPAGELACPAGLRCLLPTPDSSIPLCVREVVPGCTYAARAPAAPRTGLVSLALAALVWRLRRKKERT